MVLCKHNHGLLNYMSLEHVAAKLDKLVDTLSNLPKFFRNIEERLADRPTHADIVLVKEEIDLRLGQLDRRLDVMMDIVRKDHLS